MAKIPMVALALGIVGMLLGGGTLVVSILLPSLTHGRTNWEEALWGIIPGALVLMLSFVLAVVGLIVIIVKRRKKTPA